MPDAEAPAAGSRLTCSGCGQVMAIGPAPLPLPPPPPPPLPPPRRRAQPPATARRLSDAPPAPPEPHTLPEAHEQFFASAPGSHQHASGLEADHPSAASAPKAGRRLALGAAAAGLLVAGLWWTQRADAPSAPVSAPVRPPSPAPAPPVAIVEVAPRPAEPPPAPPDGAAVAARAEARAAAQAALHRGGAPIATQDRALLDLLTRKQDLPAVAAPAAGELSTGRSTLDGAAIRSTLAANASAFSACITRAGRADPGPRREKRVPVLELVVRPTGRVSKATLDDPAYARSALGQCLSAAGRRMVFPSFEGEDLLIQAPLKLSAVQ